MSRETPALAGLKMVIRCRDYAASRRFYVDLLGLAMVSEWDGERGAGCIVVCGEGAGAGRLEIYQMTERDERYQPAFSRPLDTDKIELQLAVASLDPWLVHLGGRWPHGDPVTMPWGGRRLMLRDPDNLLVALDQAAGGGS